MLIKLKEIVYDASGKLILREIFIRKDSVILIVDDTQMTKEVNESLGTSPPVSKIITNFSGLRREIFALGAAAEIKAKLNMVPGKTLLHG